MDAIEVTEPVRSDAPGADETATVLRPSLVGSTSEQCPTCSAPMTADQRYCVECGERRSEPRLPFMDGRPRLAQEAPRTPKPSRRLRMSASGTLIAGVGTLLLAMATGVLIGRAGDHSSRPASSGVQLIAAPNGGATGVTGPAGTGAVAAAKSGSGSKKVDGGSKASKAAAGGQAKNPAQKLPPPVVKVGSPGHGRGYKHGKFTGDFFGP